MKNIAFVLDPDNYWIEILPRSKAFPATEVQGKPSFQQTMLRIKDPALSVPFYEKVFGLTLVCKRDFPEWKFSLYFMGTFTAGTKVPTEPTSEEAWQWISSLSSTLLELTHNHGTESDPDFKGYHNGNTDPRGFGHIGFLTDNLD
jgi:lactoylglutathione lyase